MEWLGPATAIGLIFFVSGVVSIAQLFLGARQRSPRRRHGHGNSDVATHLPHHSPREDTPALDEALHSKVDQLLERVPRSSFWRNTTWGVIGYGLAKLADFGLYYLFDV
jgi:hypothetical protein